MEIDPGLLTTLATKADLESLATKAELAAAIESLATKAELAAAIAPLATKAELAAAIAPLATKDELAATKTELKAEIAALRTELKAEIRDGNEQTRRHFDVVAESLRSSMHLIGEGHQTLQDAINTERVERKADVDQLDRRVTRLEARRRPR